VSSRTRFGYWLTNAGADHLAMIVEDLEAVPNAVTVPRIARIMRTTPSVVRRILGAADVRPVSGRIYYSPLAVSAVIRGVLNDRGDERATTIPSGGDHVLAAHKRSHHRPTYIERITRDRAERIASTASHSGQWLSCREAAGLLGVTTQTLFNWRCARDRAVEAGESIDQWPTYFRSPPRTERSDDETRRGWQSNQVEHVPSSARDELTGDQAVRSSGRHPPIVYDRNLLVVWIRKAVK